MPKLRTIADVRNDPRVDALWQEEDGWINSRPSWWCTLKEGYICPEMECGSIHEKSIKDVIKLLNTVILEKDWV
jgi:hypothetical protein